MKKSDLKWPLFLLCSRAEELHVFQLFCEKCAEKKDFLYLLQNKIKLLKTYTTFIK